MYSILKTYKYLKQKYPRAQLTISTKTNMLVSLQLYLIKQNIQGVSFDLSDRMDYQKNIYEEYEIFINPSSENNFPTEAIEAMGNGLVVITGRSNFSAEIIEDHANGIILESFNYKVLSDCIYHLIDNPNESIEISNRAIKVRNIFPEENAKKSWDELFSNIL